MTLPPLSSVKSYERRKKQKIEKIRKFFLEIATKGEQTRMAAAIYHYTNEYDSCEFLSAARKGERKS